LIQKHIDLIAIGALLFGMAVFGHTRHVLRFSPAVPVRIPVHIQAPQSPACPIVVAPHLPRIVVSL
jgi:hypothetical protein